MKNAAVPMAPPLSVSAAFGFDSLRFRLGSALFVSTVVIALIVRPCQSWHDLSQLFSLLVMNEGEI